MGALLGKQASRNLEVVNTVELKLSGDFIDEPFATARLASYKQIFPDLECIGWYTA